MDYKTIIVCLNEIGRLPQLIAAATQLGGIFDAHVTGLYIIPAVQIYPSTDMMIGASVFDGTRLYFKEQSASVKKTFETAMAHQSLSFDLHIVDAAQPSIINEVIENCRSADLILTANTNPDSSSGVEDDFVERLVMASGRPVLVLPHMGAADLAMDQMMVAWNDTRESSRAAFDALPFLQKAKLTRIITVDVAPRGMILAATIAETLDRHGVKAEITNLSSDGMAIGETLLRAAHDYGAGLLILGAYGHNRFSEMIFGGATRYVLRHLDRPILMSH